MLYSMGHKLTSHLLIQMVRNNYVCIATNSMIGVMV